MRISKLISERYNISVRHAKELLRAGSILSNKSIIKKDIQVTNLQMHITLHIENNNNHSEDRSDIDSLIISKNDFLIFLYKPPFMHVDRHKIIEPTTLSDIVSSHYSSYHLLSRLDYEASGIIACIKVGKEIKSISKKYLAVVEGAFPQKMSLNRKINAKKCQKIKILEGEGDTPTTFKLLKYQNGLSLVEVSLQNARRHQVRAYLSHLGYPILNDKLYGSNNFKAPHLMLFCFYVEVNEVTCYAERQREEFLQLYEELSK